MAKGLSWHDSIKFFDTFVLQTAFKAEISAFILAHITGKLYIRFDLDKLYEFKRSKAQVSLLIMAVRMQFKCEFDGSLE